MTPTLEAMAREAGGSPVDYDDPQCSIGDMAFDPEGLTRFAALVQDDAARFIEAHSRETYGVALREHNEAAEWLRALKDRP